MNAWYGPPRSGFGKRAWKAWALPQAWPAPEDRPLLPFAMVAEVEGDAVWTESIVERQSKRRLQPLPPWRATRQRLGPSVTSKAGRFAYIRGAHMLKHRKEAARPAAPDARERIPTGAGAARPDHFSGAYQRFNSNRKQMPFGTSLLERFLDRSELFYGRFE